MLFFLFLQTALAGGYTPVELLAAYGKSLPAGTLADMASRVTEATSEEKACLLLAGVPANVIAAIPGKSDGATSPAPERCVALGLAPPTDAPAAQPSAQFLAAAAEPQCHGFETRRETADVLARDIQAWMAEQARQGRTDFLTVPRTVGTTINGSGGVNTDVVVCAWRPEGGGR